MNTTINSGYGAGLIEQGAYEESAAAVELLRNISLGVVLCKAIVKDSAVVDFITVYKNSAFERHTGFDSQVGQSYFDKYPELRKREETRLFIKKIERVLATKEPEVVEGYAPIVKGWFSFEVIFSGVNEHFIIVLNRVTERVESQKKVSLLMKEQQFLIDSPNIGYWKSIDRVFSWTNATFDRMLGYRRNGLLGKPTRIVYPAQDDYDRVGCCVDNRESEHQGLHLEIFLTRKNGERRWFELVLRRHSEDGQVALMGACIDRGDQWIAKHALEDSERRLSAALDGSEAAFFDWNIATGVLKFDNKLKAILGYQVGESIDSLMQHVHRTDRANFKRFIDDSLSGIRANNRCEFRLRHLDGHWVFVQFRGKVIQFDERDPYTARRMAGTITDVSETRQFEKDTELLLGRFEALVRQHVSSPTRLPEESPSNSTTVSSLSPRQIDVLRLISRGSTSGDIAKKLFISVATVQSHRREIMRRLNQKNVAALTRYAIAAGIV